MAAPESYDDLIDVLALYDAPNTEPMPDVPDLLRAVTCDGAWDDGRAWAAALSQAIAISCSYADVAAEVYGRRVGFFDDRGPLRARWFDAPYTLLPAVVEALVDAAGRRPAQWVAVMRAMLARVEACGGLDATWAAAAVAAAAGTACEHEVAAKLGLGVAVGLRDAR
jgi:hypothetical protein